MTLDIRLRGIKGLSKGPRCIGTEGPNPFTILFYSILFFTSLIFFIHVLVDAQPLSFAQAAYSSLIDEQQNALPLERRMLKQ
jgi:hypothetical protein